MSLDRSSTGPSHTRAPGPVITVTDAGNSQLPKQNTRTDLVRLRHWRREDKLEGTASQGCLQAAGNAGGGGGQLILRMKFTYNAIIRTVILSFHSPGGTCPTHRRPALPLPGRRWPSSPALAETGDFHIAREGARAPSLGPQSTPSAQTASPRAPSTMPAEQAPRQVSPRRGSCGAQAASPSRFPGDRPRQPAPCSAQSSVRSTLFDFILDSEKELSP